MVKTVGTTITNQEKSIVFFQTAFLGDVLLTLPALFHLKSQQKVSIKYVVLQKWSSVLRCYPFIDHVIGIEKKDYRNPLGWADLRLRIGTYDTFISAQRSLSSFLFSTFGIKKTVVGFDSRLAQLWKRTSVRYDRRQPEIVRISNLFRSLSIPPLQIPFQSQLPLRFSSEDETWFKSLALPEKSYLVLAPGSRWPTKRWPLRRFLELEALVRQRTRLPTVWVGLREELHDPSTLDHHPHVYLSVLSLSRWLLLLSRSKGIICNDSAATHVGTLHQVPTVTVFGPTTQEIGYAPTHPASKVAEIDLECRPCSIHGTLKCPLTHHSCMEMVTADHVLKLCRSLNMIE